MVVMEYSPRQKEGPRIKGEEHHDNAHSSGARMSSNRIFNLDPHQTFSLAAS